MNTPELVSVQEFCRLHGFSKSTFYNLLKRGCAPRVTKVGTRSLISSKAAAEWRQKMERESDTKKSAQG